MTNIKTLQDAAWAALNAMEYMIDGEECYIPEEVAEDLRNALEHHRTILGQQSLTVEEIVEIAKTTQSAEPGRDGYILPVTFARAIEAAHHIKEKA